MNDDLESSEGDKTIIPLLVSNPGIDAQNMSTWSTRISDAVKKNAEATEQQTKAIEKQTAALSKAMDLASTVGPWAKAAVIIAGIAVAIPLVQLCWMDKNSNSPQLPVPPETNHTAQSPKK